ncbi:MAG: amidohydrolase [Desulfobacteraceae bacterium]|nr:amidohydrolase [Desulfobacteraceae bacterium]
MVLAADLILYNGTIHTLDETHPIVTALAVVDNKISALGRDKDILDLAGPSTQKIDLEKRLVLPGFCDTHFHFYGWALRHEIIDFSKTKSFAQMEAAIRTRAEELGPGHWVSGQGFNESDWPENKIPDRRDLDRVAPDNPVCIWRGDFHLAVANSLALKLAGIDEKTNNPQGGIILRDSGGLPTGVLKEAAPNLIREVIPQLPESKVLENMEKAIFHAHGLGLTGVHDIRFMGIKEGMDAMGIWQTLDESGKLKLRCHVGLSGESLDQAIQLGLRTGFGNDRLKIGYLKFFADGSMGARTAWMTQKYLDGDYGIPVTPIKKIEDAVMKADRAGLSCMIHTIGDRACGEIIDMFSRVEQQNQSRCRLPHRMEHVQMILPGDLEKLALLKNLAVSCQPTNLGLDISMINLCLGDRGKFTYNLKNILNTGIPMMLSSDAPVTDPNPFVGIYSAVTRKRMDKTPEGGWYPKQALGVAEAVQAYTLTPAQTSGCGHILGSIIPGKLADIIVADQNIFEIAPDDIAKTKIWMTIFNGKIVYEG